MKQGIREQSSVPKYPVGKRIPIGDWVFHYCKAKTALLQHLGGANQDVFHEQNTAVVASAGDIDLTIVDGSATLDEYKGGYITVWTTTVQILLRIKGNDASDGVNTVLHLTDPLLSDVSLATYTNMHSNLYRNVGRGGAGIAYRSFVCIPLIDVTINYYFWGLTWGPAIATAHTGSGQGSGVRERNVYFQDDGSIDIPSRVSGNTDAQPAGFLLPDTTNGDDIFFMLQLAP